MHETALDDHFGLRPRDKRPAVHLEEEMAEAPLAEHICERLSRDTTVDERAQARELTSADLVARRVEGRTTETEDVGGEDLGIDPRRGNSSRSELGLDGANSLQGQNGPLRTGRHDA
jgi:hypothetical protein